MTSGDPDRGICRPIRLSSCRWLCPGPTTPCSPRVPCWPAQPNAYDASLAHQAIGIVLRDHGDLPGAIAELRKGVRLARASGGPEREADVQATLGVTLAWAGRSQHGLAVLDRAVAASRGGLAGRVLMRRASVLWDLGRFREAHQDLCRALPYLRRAGDKVWEARSLTRRAEVFLGLGLPGRAAADFARAEELFAANGQELEYAYARHNRGLAGAEPRRPSRGAYLPRRGGESLRGAWRDRPRASHRSLLRAAGRGPGRRSGAGDRYCTRPDTAGGRDRLQERRSCSSLPPPPPWLRATRPSRQSGHARRAGCSGHRTGRLGGPRQLFSPKPGMRPASVPPACPGFAGPPPPVWRHLGPTRRCGRTCSPAASRCSQGA